MAITQSFGVWQILLLTKQADVLLLPAIVATGWTG
jgi:hypothetical protein